MRADRLQATQLDDAATAISASRASTRASLRTEPRTRRAPDRTNRRTALRGENARPDDLVLDRYRLTKRLGSGAFGTVWSARDERLERDVAVKVLPREQVIHARFEREARAAARLQHPAIVTLYEAAVDDEGAYLVSELVRGRTLDRLLTEGRLSDREILEVGVSLCDALVHAHGQGVIHRDVKPSNVLVPSGGRAAAMMAAAGARAKLTDFGVAHVVGAASLTRTGDVIGTLEYMAPEQADGEEVGPEADLYSLALVLYEALGGVNPQLHPELHARRHRRTGATFVPPLRRQRRDLPRSLAAGVDRALRPRPHERGGLLDLRAALLRSLDDADDSPGVVAPGWGGHDPEPWELDEPGPEWNQAPRLRLSGGRAGRSARGSAAAGPLAGAATGALAANWLPRSLNAAGAGIGAAWLCVNLSGHPPLPPALAGLVAAVVALMLPLLGSTFTAVALGAVTLAGATPAVIGQLGGSWWRRALAAAAGLCLLVGVARASNHDLYWLPARIPPHPLEAIAAVGVWAAAAALAPLLRIERFPLLSLLLCVAWSSALVMGVQAVGARPIAGELPSALLGTAILAWRPLLTLLEETRRFAGIHADVA